MKKIQFYFIFCSIPLKSSNALKIKSQEDIWESMNQQKFNLSAFKLKVKITFYSVLEKKPLFAMKLY